MWLHYTLPYTLPLQKPERVGACTAHSLLTTSRSSRSLLPPTLAAAYREPPTPFFRTARGTDVSKFSHGRLRLLASSRHQRIKLSRPAPATKVSSAPRSLESRVRPASAYAIRMNELKRRE